MCELKVVLNGKEIFYECIYAKTIDGKVLLKDVLGSVKEFPNCYIEEVNIGRKTLMLKSVEDQSRSLVGRIVPLKVNKPDSSKTPKELNHYRSVQRG